MKYSDLVKELSERLDIPQKEVRRLVKQSTEVMQSILDGNLGFTIPGFGTFSTRMKQKRKSFNPNDGTHMMLPKKRIVTFTPSSAFKENLIEGRGRDEQ